MTNNKFKFQIRYNFYYRLCVDHSWKITLKIIALREGGCNFVYISFSTFTAYLIICRVKNNLSCRSASIFEFLGAQAK